SSACPCFLSRSMFPPSSSSLSLHLHFFPSSSVQDGGPPESAQEVRVAGPVIVTPAFAKASPLKVPPVCVMAAPARIVPTKFEFVVVAAWATHQKTLHGCAPLARTTEKLVVVRAPVPRVPILKIQTALLLPFASSVTTAPVDVSAASKQ